MPSKMDVKYTNTSSKFKASTIHDNGGKIFLDFTEILRFDENVFIIFIHH